MVVVVFALASDLSGSAGRHRVGVDEGETLSIPDPGMVVDDEADGIAEGRGPRQVNHQRIADLLEAERHGAWSPHRPDLQQVAGVQHHGVEPRAQRPQPGGDPAVQAETVPIELTDLDLLVQEVVIVDRL